MITKKQINLSPKKVSSWLSMIIIFSTIIVLIFISIFLYKNFYQTITQTKKILFLRDKAAFYSVDIEKFDLIIDRLTKKTLPKKLENVISPFR